MDFRHVLFAARLHIAREISVRSNLLDHSDMDVQLGLFCRGIRQI